MEYKDMWYAKVNKMIWHLFFLGLICGSGRLFSQTDSSDFELFPDDLFLQGNEIEIPNIRVPIRSQRLHFVIGYRPLLSQTSDQYKNSFGKPSSSLTTMSGFLLGTEYRISLSSVFVELSVPQKFRSKFVAQDHGISNNFITKHELSYGTLFRVGMMFNLKQTSRWDFGVGLGINYQTMVLKITLLSDENAVSNSVIFIDKKSQDLSTGNLFGVAAADFYVLKDISIQAKFGLDLQKSTKFEQQKVIRRQKLYVGHFDYVWHVFKGIDAGGNSLLFEIGTRWHLQ
jgi:hypothetical protein